MPTRGQGKTFVPDFYMTTDSKFVIWKEMIQKKKKYWWVVLASGTPMFKLVKKKKKVVKTSFKKEDELTFHDVIVTVFYL